MIILFFARVVTSAQNNNATLTLKEAIDSAISNNDHVQLAKMDEDIATSNYKQTQAVYLPQLGFSYTAMTTNNPLNAFGFKLQQQSITQEDFNPVLLNNPPGTTDFMTKLQLQQPLVNMDMLYMRKGAEKQVEVYQYKTQRTKQYIAFQVQQAYLQLQLAYNAKAVLEEALNTAKGIAKSTGDYFEQGLVQKSDLLNAQLQVTKTTTNIAEVNSNIQNASDALSQLMGKAKGVTYSIPASFSFAGSATVAESLPEARADFKAMESAIGAYDLQIKSNKMSYLPKLNAFASYQLNDNTAFGFGSNAYLAGLQLSWDIFKGNATKNKIATQTLERNKLAEELNTQKSESELELNKAKRQLADAQYTIAQQKAAVAQAQEALRILQDRYEQGLVKTTDVLMAQTQLSQQKLAEAQAVFNANLAAAYIQFLTSTNQ
ncbi:TolC family protein [Panacibacter ginsenosidivorans]|uniref:TolC family protein n=2 Tax=Panacibacter ginsenosidivorans TaxID=1813871 RepID=A0A5B8VGC9_9BACT|nr:TolC family protein [Panacibacter ginsenosidivorans]